jgi:hypothetical protein
MSPLEWQNGRVNGTIETACVHRVAIVNKPKHKKKEQKRKKGGKED